MVGPLMVLATGAILAGFVFYGGFVGSSAVHHGEGAPHETASAEEHTETASEEHKTGHKGDETLKEEIEQDIAEAAVALSEEIERDEKQIEKAGETVKEIVKGMENADTHAKMINLWSKDYFWHDSIKVLPANDTVEAAHNVPFWVKKLPLVMGLLGIALAYLAYIVKPGMPAIIVRLFKPIYKLFFNKWFFDEIYHAVFVKNAFTLGRGFWIYGDKNTIDGIGPDGVAGFSKRFAGNLSRFQSGYVFQYAFVMMIALFSIMTWFVLKADPSFYMTKVQEPKVISEPIMQEGTP